MAMRETRPRPGAIALVGSGEYLPVMTATDTYLLETLGGAASARVALLPTASGHEEQRPEYWNDLGRRHFQQLGVREIRETGILDRADASDPEQLALLRDVDLYYFSGGDPQHLIETLRGSPAWEIMTTSYAQGAVLAGCSAGAMALSGYTIALRQMMLGNRLAWSESLGIVPRLIVFPHFDRMAAFIDQTIFEELLSTLPAAHIAVGIDENTALVRIEAPAGTDPFAPTLWKVMGEQTIRVFERDQASRTLNVGEDIML